MLAALIALFALQGASFDSRPPALAQDKKMDWKKDYAAALKDARQQNKYLVVHFTGPG